MTPAAPATSRRRTRLWVGGVTIGLPPVVVLAASDTTPEVRPPDDRWRALGVGDNQAVHNGSVYAVLAMAFAALVWALYTGAQRLRHIDLIHAAQQKTWERMLTMSEERSVRLEGTVKELIGVVTKQADTARDLAANRERLATMGRELDETKAQRNHAQRRVDQLLPLVGATNGGFVPNPIEPVGAPVYG